MFEGRRILVVVPARGGSKGVTLKNLRLIHGVSLVEMAAAVIKELDFVDRAVVSTDHEGIAAVCEAAGLPAPFRRPPWLSGDQIADWDVLHHALETMESQDGVPYDIVVMLQPTSPSRTPVHVHGTVMMLIDGGFDSVWTVSETDSKAHPLKQLTLGRHGELDYYDPAGAQIIARQQLSPVYHRNGIAYAITRDCLEEQRSIMGANTGAMVIADKAVNIDTEDDLRLAELLLPPAGEEP